MKTRIAGLAIDAEHLALRDFSSDLIPARADPIRARDRLRFDGLLPGDLMRTMPVTLEVQRDRLQSGSSIFGANALISRSVGEMSLSNLLHLSSASGTRSLDGALQVASDVGRLHLRGQVNYDLKPGSKLSALALSSDSMLGAGYLLNVSAARTFAGGESRLNTSINKSMGGYAVALSAGFSKRGEAQVGIQLFSSFGRDPRKSQWIFDSLPMTESGAVSARVFVDRNGNGVMDAGEQRLPMADGSEKVVAQVRSSADGFFIVQDVLPSDYQLRVAAHQLEQLNLADPGPRRVKISDTGSQVNGQNFMLAPK